MATVRLDEECLAMISKYESITGAGSRDCLVDDKNNRIIFVVNPGEMGRAIGKGGVAIKRASNEMGRQIEVVEYSEDRDQFISNCFLPAKVVSIIYEQDPDGREIALVNVNEDDYGLAIGRGGKNIWKAKMLASRQHEVDEVRLNIQEE